MVITYEDWSSQKLNEVALVSVARQRVVEVGSRSSSNSDFAPLHPSHSLTCVVSFIEREYDPVCLV